MGLNIGSIFSGGIKPILQSAIGQIPPQVEKMLQGIVGDSSDFGGSASGATDVPSGLSSPLEQFSGMLNKFAPELSGLADSALQSILGKSSDAVNARDDGQGNQVSTDGMNTRGNVDQLANTSAAYNTAVSTASGSSSSAATAASSTDSSSTVGASYSSFAGPQDINIPPMPSSQGLNLKDPNVMAKYQEDMQFYTQMVQLRSKIAEMLHDTRKGIIQSMRA